MKHFKDMFRRKETQEPQPLRIDGIPPAPMTAEPDDAELAAQALLEMMAGGTAEKDERPEPDAGTAAYYRRLAGRIRQAQDSARVRATRFVAFVEQELLRKDLPVSGDGSLGLLEAELYKRIDVIERVGGELKRRWQHCLADVTARLMQAVHTDNGNGYNNIDDETQSLKTTDHESP